MTIIRMMTTPTFISSIHNRILIQLFIFTLYLFFIKKVQPVPRRPAPFDSIFCRTILCPNTTGEGAPGATHPMRRCRRQGADAPPPGRCPERPPPVCHRPHPEGADFFEVPYALSHWFLWIPASWSPTFRMPEGPHHCSVTMRRAAIFSCSTAPSFASIIQWMSLRTFISYSSPNSSRSTMRVMDFRGMRNMPRPS